MRRLALFSVAALLTSPCVFAQDPAPYEGPPPPHVSVVDGSATLEREGRPETAPLNMPVLPGDRLRTARGRVEVLFGDGSTLHVDASTTVDLQGEDLLRLIDGRLRLNIPGSSGDARQAVSYRVDSSAGSVRIAQPGEYRIALLHGREETQLELAVLRGAADLFTDEGTTSVGAGERAYASAGLIPSYTYAFNSAQWDEFDEWSEARRDERLSASAQYLPADMRAYAPVFDEDGDWRYSQPYGYVWYPRVATSWRPYYYGRWASYPRYGWTWIGIDRFSWPTHHYGRWGFSAGAWFWIPGSRWAPAYVSWAYAPGYVSWCPLGFDNRPVFSIGFNVGPGYYSAGPGFYAARAWTIVSSPYFGRGWVHQRAVGWDRFERGRRPAFQVRPTPPAYRAASRGDVLPPGGGSRGVPVTGGSGAPVRGGGSATAARDAAVQRDTAVPRYTNRGEQIIRSQTARPVPPAPRGAASTPGVRPTPSRPAYAPTYGVPQRTAPERGAMPAYPRGPAYDRTPASPARPGAAVPAMPPGYAAPDRSAPRMTTPYPGYGGRPGMEPRPVGPPMRGPASSAPQAQPREYARPGGAVARPDSGAQRPAAAPRGAPAAGPASRPSGGTPQAVPRHGGGRGGR